jgi:beta-lactamase class A
LRLIAYGVLLVLAAKVSLMAWDAVSTRRAELRQRSAAMESSVQIQSPVNGVPEGWTDATLAGLVHNAISPTVGTAGVYVKSLNTGAMAAEGEDTIFPMASLFKVPILVELLRQQSLGMSDMNTVIHLQQKYWSDGSGVLQAQIGKDFPVHELVDYMIRISDNVAALALLDLVGTDNVNLTLQANGLEKTRLRIGDSSRDWGGPPGENTTTAREMGLLLEKLATGKILNDRYTNEAIRLLSVQQQVSWLPALLPTGVKVAHKSGELPGVRHDAGVVYGKHSQFVAVVLTSNLGNLDDAAESIARVAKVTYDYLENGKK